MDSVSEDISVGTVNMMIEAIALVWVGIVLDELRLSRILSYSKHPKRRNLVKKKGVTARESWPFVDSETR